MMTDPQRGDVVRLTAKAARAGGHVPIPSPKAREARIVDVYADVDGGVRLDKPVCGFYSWNVKDLDLIQRHYPIHA